MIIKFLTELPEEGVSHDPQLRKRMILRDGEVPHLKKFGQVRMVPGQVAHAHAHATEYEVFLVEAGEGTARVGGSDHAMLPGSCLVFEPSEVHEIVSTGPGDLVLTYFGVDISEQAPADLSHTTKIPLSSPFTKGEKR